MMRTAQAAVHPPKISGVISVSAWLLVTISLTVLTGWAFDLLALARFVPQSVEMKANSAAAMLLAALALLRREHRDRSIYATLVMLIGAATLAQYVFNSDFGIDQLLFRDTHYFVSPGRMSEYTSTGFVFFGLSLLLMKSSNRMLRELARVLAVATGTMGVIVLVSHAFATPSLDTIGPHRKVAVPTALGFVIGAIGVQYANPFEGWVRLLHARNPGGRMLRRLLPTALLGTLVFGFLVITAHGQFRWESGFSLSLVGAGVAACLVAVIVHTAAALEQEDLAREESEERFRLAANSAPVMIWMSGTDRLCDYFNDRWLEFTGRTREAEFGNGWAEGVHPDDLKECISRYVDAFDRREPFQVQYRLRRHDGEYRWIFDTGVPRFIGETFAGYIGSCIDVTERKLAEEALADLERKVLNAQEEERSRIARELHDDINQRIAMLIWELGTLGRTRTASETMSRDVIHSAVAQLQKLASDVQGISHRLHSSHLEYLGLGAAVAALCKELAAQREVEIDFRADPVLPRLSKNNSLCLYRVAQEALQNAMKHSGVRSFKVELRGDVTEVRLTVSDSGMGFDPARTDKQQGLGLISMRERLRLARGEFVLESEPGHGTTIRCRIPAEIEAPAEDMERIADRGRKSEGDTARPGRSTGAIDPTGSFDSDARPQPESSRSGI